MKSNTHPYTWCRVVGFHAILVDHPTVVLHLKDLVRGVPALGTVHGVLQSSKRLKHLPVQ